MEELRAALTLDARGRAAHYRRLGAACIAARRHFRRADGTPDLGGRSRSYQRWLADRYGEAGVPPRDRDTLGSAIRYHGVNHIRATVPEERWEEYGVHRGGPARAGAEHRRLRALNSAARDHGILTVAELEGQLAAAEAALSRVNPRLVALASAEERLRVEGLARRLQHRAARIAAVARGV